MRDMRKTLETAQKPIEPTAYQLTVDECCRLYEKAATGASGTFYALGDAFDYGFILGRRYEKSLQDKRKQKAKEGSGR